MESKWRVNGNEWKCTEMSGKGTGMNGKEWNI